MEWLSYFELHSRWEGGGHRILVMDGHSSYVNLNFVSFCWQHKIVLVCLPPHLTYLLQPLDLVLFRKLKQAYSDEVTRRTSLGY